MESSVARKFKLASGSQVAGTTEEALAPDADVAARLAAADAFITAHTLDMPQPDPTTGECVGTPTRAPYLRSLEPQKCFEAAASKML